MDRRPRIKIEMTVTDKLIEFIGWLALMSIWVLILISFFNLPETIPTHYNGSGQIDGYGKRINILVLPLMATLFFVGITILNKFPHIFNYPTKIKNDNALKHYTNITRMNRYVKLVFVAIFGMLAYKTIHASGGLGARFLPLTMGLFLFLLIYFIFKSSKTKPFQAKEIN
jgi:uncharacterized membrane protein